MGKKKPITSYEGLTVKQQRFVDFYDGNGTEAAEKARYSTPRQEAARLLTNVNIKAALRTRELRRRRHHIWTREERQRFWTRVISGEETQSVVVGTDADGNDIVTDIPPKMTDRLRASELLGRSEGDFIDKIGVGGVGPNGEITEIPFVFVKAPKREEEKEVQKQIPLNCQGPPV